MTTWIALFRGINVGGNNILPMAQLREQLGKLKLANVRTYIQSGNVVFESNAKTASSLAGMIGACVETQFGFRPSVLILSADNLNSAIQTNPFPKATDAPKTLSFFFLDKPAIKPDIEALNADKAPEESFVLTDSVFYLHVPNGMGRSKLATRAEKHLGVVTTARNYRTVSKLRAMVAETDT